MTDQQPGHIAESGAPQILLASQRYAQDLANQVARLRRENEVLKELLSDAQTDILRHECGALIDGCQSQENG